MDSNCSQVTSKNFTRQVLLVAINGYVLQSVDISGEYQTCVYPRFFAAVLTGTPSPTGTLDATDVVHVILKEECLGSSIRV